MKRLSFLLVVLGLFLAPLARAEESCANVATTTGGTTVLTAANNKGNSISCQNVGATNSATCSVGGTPVAVQHGRFLTAAGGNFTMAVAPVTNLSGSGQSRLPTGAVTCITGSSTTYVCCDSW